MMKLNTNKTYSEKKSVSHTDKWQGLPRMRLTARDAAIVLAIYQYRALSTPQIERLFFSDERVAPKEQGKPNTRCQHRLQRLYQHGYLMREEQPQRLSEGRRPYVYFLSERGAQVVEELLGEEELEWHPKERKASSFFLTHLLATNDVRVEVTVAARKHGFTIAKWLDDLTLKRQHMTDTVTVIGPTGARQRAAVVPIMTP